MIAKLLAFSVPLWFAVLLILGAFVAGALVYRNNAKAAKKALADLADLRERVARLGIQLAIVLGLLALGNRSSSAQSTQRFTLSPGDTLVVIAPASGVVTPPPPPPPPPPVTGAFHEPSGYTTVVNTGAITVAPPCGAGGLTWQINGQTWSMWSSNVTSATGENCANLQLIPGHSGYRVFYPANTAGGNSPVRFGTGFSAQGTGSFYARYNERVEAGWTTNGNAGAKNWEPRTPAANGGGNAGGTGQNDVIGFSDNGTALTDAWLQFLQQGSSTTDLPCWEYCRGANGHYGASAGPTSGWYADSSANLGRDNQWHRVEWLVTVNSPLGTANGCLYLYVDSKLEWKECDVKWFIAGNTAAWTYWMSDPTYGGGTHSPPAGGVAWDFDSLYVSVH